MKKMYFVILALLAGCTQQPQMEGNNLIITAFSTGFDTKATETAFESGDKIGIFMENNASNLRYETADGSVWKGFGNVGQFAAGDKVTAYFPYSETATNMHAIEVSENVDFMLTSATPITVEGNKASANLKFRHVLGKLVVNAEVVEINGVKTVSLDSVVVKNVFRKGVIDLATEKISGLTDKGDLRGSGNEVIVIPQTVQKMKLVFKMENGEFDSLAYNSPIVLNSGEKTTFTARSNADLYFTSTLDLKSGEAQTNLPLSFYVAPGRSWTLTSSESWLTVTPNQGTGAATVKVNVTQNAGVPRTATITLTDDKQAVTTQKPMQNYIRTVTINGVKWTTRNLTASAQGQKTGFTLCANPQDYGCLWKWGSLFANDHTNGSSPSDDWGGGTVGSGSYPDGDPCKSLGAYKTPTHEQWQALIASGYSSWTTYEGINGYFFGPNATSLVIQDGSIFLPAAGYRRYNDGLLSRETTNGYYWSSSVGSSTYGWHGGFFSGVVDPNGHNPRGQGFSVRCVAE